MVHGPERLVTADPRIANSEINYKSCDPEL